MLLIYVENDEEVEILEIYLIDKLKNVKVILIYNVFEEFDVIIKCVKIINESEDNVSVLRVLSFNVDFKEDDFDFIYLFGVWVRERYIVRISFRCGM